MGKNMPRKKKEIKIVGQTGVEVVSMGRLSDTQPALEKGSPAPLSIMQPEIEKALTFCASIQEIEVTTGEQYEASVEVCRLVKQHINGVEAARKKEVAPFNARVKEINDFCRPVSSQLVDLEKKIKSAMERYDREQQKRQRELEEARQREVEDLGLDPLDDATISLPAVPVAPKVEGVSYRTVWRTEVTDLVAAVAHCVKEPTLQPLVSLDIGRVEKLAAALQGNLKIPGLIIKSERVTSVRT
jgi:hypothetical protein